jgi:hypothetical protein
LGSFAYGDIKGPEHGIRLFISFNPLQTSSDAQDVQVTLARGICHAVIDQLPDAALPELFESLTNMFDFYRAPQQRVIPLPAPRRVLSAKVTGRHERRPLSFDTE